MEICGPQICKLEFGGRRIAPMNDNRQNGTSWVERTGIAISNWTERWFPDAFVFALAGVVVVFIAGVLMGEPAGKLALEGGKSFWGLIPFTMQMAMVIIGGYIVATSPAVYRFIEWLARIPKTPKGAVAFIAFFSMASSLLSWGFSLIFSGLLTRAIAACMEKLDYRAAGSAAYLGLGAVWALGLSSSAALLMATKASIPPKLFEISGLIPLSQSIFLWQSVVMAAVLLGVSVLIAWWSAPAENGRTAKMFGIDPTPVKEAEIPASKPGEWLERSPLLNLCAAAILLWYIADVFRTSPQGALAALDLNTYNLIFITAGLLLQWTPGRFMRSVNRAVPAVGGVLIQFPFYAVIFGMISGTGISSRLAEIFTAATTHGTYPLLVALYSAGLGIFIPSGGSKWVVEASYVLAAANAHQVHLGWVIQIYNAAEALPNLVNPFWMLPLLGILGLKARDLVGYAFLQLIVHVPLVFFLCWAFAQSLQYIPPLK